LSTARIHQENTITDSRTQLLMGKFLRGELKAINPILEPRAGLRYPEAEHFVEDKTEAEAYLEHLRDIGVLRRSICGYLVNCNACGSPGIEQLEAKINPTPEDRVDGDVHWRCQACKASFRWGEVSVRPVYSYALSEDAVERFAGGLIVRPIMDFLVKRGYEITSPGTLKGESEVLHVFDVLAYNVEHPDRVIALDFFASDRPVGEDRVISMFAKVYDANPPRSVLVVFPGLTMKARRLAEQYELEVVESSDLDSLWKDLRQVIPPVGEFRFESLDVMTLLSLPDHLRKSASVVCEKGRATADEISEATGRARAVESGYLNQLVRMGYLAKEREGRKVLFSVTS